MTTATPVGDAPHAARRRLGLRGEFALAALPTATVLLVLVFVEVLVALLGPGYAAAAGAMVATIVVMIATDAVHPPGVSTALSFALGAGQTRAVVLFGLALGVTATLVLIQQLATRLLARLSR
ncbi:MAG TPA: hypothetical protein VGD56_10850 [Gemmatirosa sp.]